MEKCNMFETRGEVYLGSTIQHCVFFISQTVVLVTMWNTTILAFEKVTHNGPINRV